MITQQDLQAAIAECQGQRNPNASTCIKLAAYYTIKNELYSKPNLPSYSYASGMVEYESDSEFGKRIRGKDPAQVFPVIDELMDAIQVLNPRLYASVLRKL